MHAFDRFQELWSDYLEGELDAQGLAELRELLATDPKCQATAIEQYQIHRVLGLLSHSDSDAFISATLKRVPDSSDEFVAKVVSKVESRGQSAATARNFQSRTKLRWPIAVGAALAASLLIVATVPLSGFKFTTSSLNSPPKSQIKFTNTSRSKFLGAFAPAMGSEAIRNHEYVLTSGSVQLHFPNGAEVIVQGPAVFQVAHESRLNVAVGRCSVYCPPGAEGFVVDTPNAQVVDRGTRFFVSVVESSATEVHVIDGVADIVEPLGNEKSQATAESATQSGDSTAPDMVRLTENQARKIDSNHTFTPKNTNFQSSLYQYRLPDRILSYEATHENGGAKNLKSISVQRSGTNYRIPVEELIGCKLTWFRIEQKILDMRHLAGDPQLPVDRQELLEDLALNTGAINPGGSVEPFQGDPIIPGPDIAAERATPGVAIEFVRPVINGPGPDVVFFELQSVAGNPDGDPFHVLPLHLSGNRQAITVKSYDLSLTSPEVERPANFYLHEFERPVDSINELMSADCRALARPQGSAAYRVLATSIDLSAMGFGDGEAVSALFFQDSLDDANHVDPVGIWGLPPIQ